VATNKTIKSVVLFILFLNFLFLAYSAYPNLVYTQSSFPSGQVDINVQASSGLKVSLYVNGNYVGQKDSIAAQKDVYLTSDIVDQNIAIGQALRFVNNNSVRTYPLNFTTGTFQSLSFGESVIFRSYKEEFVDYYFESVVRDRITHPFFTTFFFAEIEAQRASRQMPVNCPEWIIDRAALKTSKHQNSDLHHRRNRPNRPPSPSGFTEASPAG